MKRIKIKASTRKLALSLILWGGVSPAVAINAMFVQSFDAVRRYSLGGDFHSGVASNTGDPVYFGGIAVQGESVYFRKFDGVVRSDFDGSSSEVIRVTSWEELAFGLAVNSNHLYWGESGNIWRSDLAGSVVTRLTSSGSIDQTPAISEEHLFWSRDGDLWRAGLDGTGAVEIVSDAGFSFQLNVYQNRLYWGVGGAIISTDLNGDDRTQFLVPVVDPTIRTIAVAGDYIYASVAAFPLENDGIYRMGLDGSNPVLLDADEHYVWAMSVVVDQVPEPSVVLLVGIGVVFLFTGRGTVEFGNRERG